MVLRNEGDLIAPLLSEFEKAQPGTKVILTRLAWDSEKPHQLATLPEAEVPERLSPGHHLDGRKHLQ